MQNLKYQKHALTGFTGVSVHDEADLAESIMTGKKTVLNESIAQAETVESQKSVLETKMGNHRYGMMVAKTEENRTAHLEAYNKCKAELEGLEPQEESKHTKLQFQDVPNPRHSEPIHYANAEHGQYQIYHAKGAPESSSHVTMLEPHHAPKGEPERYSIGSAHSPKAAMELAHAHFAKHTKSSK